MPRIYLPGISAHIYHRGNNRLAIFSVETDSEVFLTMLKTAAARHGLVVHAFVIMTTHFHLIATPETKTALSGTMKQLGERFVGYYNRKHHRTGTLWEGRFRAKHITDERYWLTCLRYVEQNPVRAGIVATPDAHRWSSYGFHAFGHQPNWLVHHPVYLRLGSTAEQRQTAYRAICAEPLPEPELVCIRNYWRTRRTEVEFAGV
jgi:REP-associated tyrosine transposase